MNRSRIKTVRAESRATITRFFMKLDDLKEETEFGIDRADPIMDSIVNKQCAILKLDEEIFANSKDKDIDSECR